MQESYPENKANDLWLKLEVADESFTKRVFYKRQD